MISYFNFFNDFTYNLNDNHHHAIFTALLHLNLKFSCFFVSRYDLNTFFFLNTISSKISLIFIWWWSNTTKKNPYIISLYIFSSYTYVLIYNKLFRHLYFFWLSVDSKKRRAHFFLFFQDQEKMYECFKRLVFVEF